MRHFGQRRPTPQTAKKWSAERLGPMVITTRKDWQHEIVNMMDALAASRSYDFLKIAYRKESPHFSATVALNAMEPDALAEVSVIDVHPRTGNQFFFLAFAVLT